MEYLIAVLLAAVIVMLAILLYKTSHDRNGNDDTAKLISDELRRSREDEEKHLGEIRREIKEQTEKNYENSQNLSERIQRSLSEIRDRNDASIEKLQTGNEKKLEEMRKTVDEKLNETLTVRLNTSFKSVSEQLENVYKSLGEMKELSAGVTDNVTALNRVLTNVKARGTWAEVQLEGILDQTVPNMYEKNVMTDERSRAIVEFAVKIPDSNEKDSFIYLPIDSKFPMEDYIRLCDAADKGDQVLTEAAKKALEARVIDEAKSITKYINEPKTTPFAIMYLATEGLYAEIASSKNGILEKLQNEYRVMVSGPTTITAMLNSLAMGFRTVAINEKAKEVRELLAVAKVQYEKFGVVLQKAKQKIEDAGKTLEEAEKRNNIINKKLRSVEDIDYGRADEILDDSNYNEYNEISDDSDITV